MINIYRVSRLIASGNDEEYRILRELAEECCAIEIDDEIDLDSYQYPYGQYTKYGLKIKFANAIDRDTFVMRAKKII